MNLNEFTSKTNEVIAGNNFSGVISIQKGKDIILEAASGYADRTKGIPNNTGTAFGIGSGTKTFTALAIGTLIAQGKIALTTRARDCISINLPLISGEVTIGHLLSHTSGVGDYYDEEEISEEEFDNFFVAIPWYALKGPKDYIPLFINKPMKFAPGSRFSYSNGGYIILGIIIEEISGMSYQEYVKTHILDVCGMNRSGFFLMNELPANTATGYIDKKEGGYKSNIYNLPIIGASDGGMLSTMPDIKKFWNSLLSHNILDKALTASFLDPHNHYNVKNLKSCYGLGFWIDAEYPDNICYSMQGYDAGVSFVSRVEPAHELMTVIISNTTHGVWSIKNQIEKNFDMLR